MRTRLSLPLKPHTHLQPCLAFLSGQQRDSLDKLDQEVTRQIRDAPPQRWRRDATEYGIARLRERLRNNLSCTLVGKEFLDYTGSFGLDERRSFKAWWEVWHFLHHHHPPLRSLIGACPWCGRLFARLHKRDTFCSTLCGMYVQLLRVSPQDVAKQLSPLVEFVITTQRERRARFGKDDAVFNQHAAGLRKMLLRPVLSRWAEPFLFPQDVTEPPTFLVIWTFLFGTFAELSDRMQICTQCETIYWRKDKRMQTCSRACQLRRYRQKARKRPKTATGRRRSRR